MRSQIVSLWSEPQVTARPRRGRLDWAVAAALLLATTLEVVARPDLVWRPAALAIGVVLTLAVLIRRERPLAAVVVAFGTVAAVDAAAELAGSDPVILVTAVAVLVLPYALVRWSSGRDALIGLGVMGVTFIVSVVTDPTGVVDAIGGAAVLLGTAALGGAVRYRAVAREQLIQRARLEEREQIARELHDTVAHHVSGIAIQAQAGLQLAKASSLRGAADALEVIEREAAQTLAEMRVLVGALRGSDAPPVAPSHGIADIARLAVAAPAPLAVEVRLSGDLAALSPALESAVYRVAQESITNAKRHARQATRIDVEVVGGPTDVRVTVADDGSRASAVPGSAGYGLVGMTERVTLLGGTLTAGPAPGYGWTVTAVLPRKGHAP